MSARGPFDKLRAGARLTLSLSKGPEEHGPLPSTILTRCGNIAIRAVSSISALKVCLSLSANARTAAGRALISVRVALQVGILLGRLRSQHVRQALRFSAYSLASGATFGAQRHWAFSRPGLASSRRDQPQTAMSTDGVRVAAHALAGVHQSGVAQFCARQRGARFGVLSGRVEGVKLDLESIG